MSILSEISECELLVVGAGLYGLTIAERAASAGYKVAILEKRNQVGGNAYSEFDEISGVEIHKYGSHLFHTSNRRVWDYVNRFTSFNGYVHTVWTTHKGRVYPMPINLATMSSFFEKSLSPSSAKELLERQKPTLDEEPANLEEKAIALIGRELYEAFIKGYTAKQWQTDPKKLPASVISRLPVRLNYDNRYFSDVWQGLPSNGYGAWFDAMLKNTKISLFTDTDFFELKPELPKNIPIVYSGPLDRYFEYQEGHLSWRTLDFKLEHHNVKDFLGTSVMNFADQEVPYTRIHEFKHLHPERNHSQDWTVVMYEFSRFATASDEPYYPVNSPQDRAILERYRIRCNDEKLVFFGGRLGSYQYLDMHMAIASALTSWDNEILPLLSEMRSQN